MSKRKRDHPRKYRLNKDDEKQRELKHDDDYSHKRIYDRERFQDKKSESGNRVTRQEISINEQSSSGSTMRKRPKRETLHNESYDERSSRENKYLKSDYAQDSEVKAENDYFEQSPKSSDERRDYKGKKHRGSNDLELEKSADLESKTQRVVRSKTSKRQKLKLRKQQDRIRKEENHREFSNNNLGLEQSDNLEGSEDYQV